jgi:hypothetical protein
MFQLSREMRAARVWRMTDDVVSQRVSMPGRLKGALAVLCFQVLANGFLGFVVIDVVSERASHGARTPGAGLIYFVGFLSFAVAVTLLACVVLTRSRLAWIRPAVISIEVIGLISGVINLFGGQIAAVAGIALAAGVIGMFNRDDIRGWYIR